MFDWVRESLGNFFSAVPETFSSLFSWCKDVLSAISLTAYLAFLLGLIIAVCGIFWIRYILDREKNEDTEQSNDPDKVFEMDPYKSPPPIGRWLSQLLVRKGIFKVSRMATGFMYALDFLEKSLKCSKYKYKKPWIVVLGAEQSGKTTFIKSFDDALKGSWQVDGDDEYDSECNWTFLQSGVVLDIKGSLFLKNEKIIADEVGWMAFQNLLTRYRSAKPLDNIILTISAQDLYGKGKIASLRCRERAKFMAQKLSLFQDQVGLRIPIYIVITKTDVIPGFQEFCKSIPVRLKSQMFGWSNPYNLEAEYLSGWVTEALNTVSSKIIDMNMDICCHDARNQTKDSLFVFPYELEKVKENLTIYMDHLFRAGSYRSNLLLRGIYFTGDGGVSSIDSDEATEEFIDASLLDKDETEIDEAEESTDDTFAEKSETEQKIQQEQKGQHTVRLSKRLFFCGDLIYKKVLDEFTLCAPQKNFLFSANKTVRIVKIGCFAFVIICGLGGYSAYKTFKDVKGNLAPTIDSMYQFLVHVQQIPLTELSKKNESFESAIGHLTDIMEELSKATLSSLFIPPSWFSPLRSKLNDSVNLAYQNIMMRALYVNLLLKARELFNMSPQQIPVNQSLAQFIIPTKSNEFKAMDSFVKQLTDLTEHVDQFNNLRLVAAPKVLAELVDFAFHITLPQTFLKYYGLMKLNTTAFPEIDLTSYKGLARNTLKVLFQEFFNILFIRSSDHSFPVVIELLIRQLRNVDAQGLPDSDFLQKLSIDLNAAMRVLENTQSQKEDSNEKDKDEKKADSTLTDEKPLITWMDKEIFEPDETFETFLCDLDKSPFFGEDISQAIVNNCAIGLFHLRQYLAELTKTLTTDIRFAAPEIEETAEEGFCSKGIVLLSRALKTLFEQPYMRKPSPHRFIETVPEGQILYWDDKMLKVACELCQAFETFSTQKIGQIPVVLQESFRLLARNNLQHNVISLIAQAQNFMPQPSLHNDAAQEELVRSQTANVRLIYPDMLKLLEILNFESVSFFYTTLRNLLLETNYKILGGVNDLFKKAGPYHIWDPTFSWWNGKSSPAYHAYGVKDAQDLNSFLNIQSQQVVHFATMAQPVVEFLTSDIMLSVNPLDSQRLTKWRRIVDQATAFQKKQPGNSLAELETFITTTFKEYSMDNVAEKIDKASLRQDMGDHFLETKQYIQKGVLGRVEVLNRQKNIKNYQELVHFFNNRLRGRFPFTPVSSDTTQGIEVDPEDMRLFFEKFQQFGGSSEKILDQIYQISGIATEAVRFLKQIEEIFQIFQSYLETDLGGLPSAQLKIDFNVNREKSIGGNYVAEWAIRVNEDSVTKNTDKDKQTQWIYGCPTEVSFRWPNIPGLLETPFNDPNQHALQVLQSTATFSYKGRWSLLRMVRQHRAHRGEYIPMFNPNAVVLKFVIPVSQTKRAVLFNSLTFLGPSTNPNMPGKALPFPEFPTFAPNLSPEVERYRNEPVLSFGLVQESPNHRNHE